jgi:hypothetical protein
LKTNPSTALMKALDELAPEHKRAFAHIVIQVAALEVQLQMIRDKAPPEVLKFLDDLERKVVDGGTDAYMRVMRREE